TALTLEALTRHALQPDQRVRMEMEARTGEHKVERAKAQSAHELQQLLANPAPLPGSGTHTRVESLGPWRDPPCLTRHQGSAPEPGLRVPHGAIPSESRCQRC